MSDYQEVDSNSPKEVKEIAEDVEKAFKKKVMNYEELLDGVKILAKNKLESGENISGPTFFFLDEEGEMSVVVSPNVPPNLLKELLIQIFTDRNAIAYCVMSEIWAAVFEKGDALVQPRHAPNKKDAYMVAGATRMGKKQLFVGPVEKDGQKTISAGELIEQPPDVVRIYDGFLSIFDSMEKPSIN